MKIVLYLCAGVSALIGLYELTWIGRSSLAIIIIFLAFIVAINSYILARKEIKTRGTFHLSYLNK